VADASLNPSIRKKYLKDFSTSSCEPVIAYVIEQASVLEARQLLGTLYLADRDRFISACVPLIEAREDEFSKAKLESIADLITASNNAYINKDKLYLPQLLSLCRSDLKSKGKSNMFILLFQAIILIAYPLIRLFYFINNLWRFK